MSKMIPPTIHPDIKSKAEKRIFRKLQEAKGTDTWIVLHSLGLARHQKKRRGEIDFVIICPRGIFVLEVKGGRITRENGLWITEGYYGKNTLHESPYDQASSAMFALERDIRNKFTKDSSIYYALFGYGVILPDTLSFNFGSEGERDITYTIEDVRQPFKKFIGQLASFFEKRTKRNGLSSNEITEIADFLRGDFDIVPPLWIKAQETEEELLQITREQYIILDVLSRTPRVIIKGSAGTGKTLIAKKSAQNSAREQKRVLFVCYNKNLAAMLRVAMKNDTDIEIYTVYQLMDKFIRDSSLSDEFNELRDSENISDLYKIYYPEYGLLALLESDFQQWDMLVVDEGQDVALDLVLDFLDQCLKGGLEAGVWRWFMDGNNQAAVYSNLDESSLLRLENFGVSNMLNINCRNTKQIHQEAEMLTSPEIKCFARVEGLPVRYIWFNGNNGQIAALDKQIERIISQGVKPSNLTVLSARNLSDSCAVKSNDSRLTLLNDNNIGNFNDALIPYSTISSFKGLESEIIILTDIEKIEGDWWASILYVGMTRAKVELIVLLPEELKSIYSKKIKENMNLLFSDDE